MKAEDVKKQLCWWLPRFTDVFTDQISVSSLTMDGAKLVTAICAVPHGLDTNDYVNIVGAYTKNPITSLTRSGVIASATTQYVHDLTAKNPNEPYSYTPTVNISGADQVEYNGEHTLLSVLDRTHFTYQVSGIPATPATGSPVLEYEYYIGYNGRHKITKINDTTFTYVSPIIRPPETLGTIVAHKTPRIAPVISSQRAVESYTEQANDKLWLFITTEDVISSKNRAVESDANDLQGSATDFRQLLIQNLNLFVFVPTTQEISGRKAKDLMEDVAPAIFKSLLGVNFPDTLSTRSQWGITFVSHSLVEYNTAYYVHSFQFQEQKQINWGDTWLSLTENVAFRDIEINYFSPENDNDIMQSIINLDEDVT